MRILFEKVKEVLFSVLPITAIVLLLHLTVIPLPGVLLMRFILGTIFIVIGLSIFLFGVDIGVSPLGKHIGNALSRSKKIWIIVIVGVVVGFFVSIAEPDLQILAGEVASVTGGYISAMAILVSVSIGIGVMLVVGFFRILYNFPLYKLLTILYGIIFVLAFFISPEFLAISFDASGATTGALTVPFILAISLGVSLLKKDSIASEKDSFGLVAIASTGAILGVMLLGVFTRGDISGIVEPVGKVEEVSVLVPFVRKLPLLFFESVIALSPLVVIYIAFQIRVFKFGKKAFKKILKGLLYTLIGLVLFLLGVNAGFMDVGAFIGEKIAGLDNSLFSIGIGFALGFVTILAEPAVHVLTDQIETVTSGYIKKIVVLAALSIGVGAAVALSVLRITMPQIELWHFVLPGYIISIVMSFFVPKLFVGIAFDSGGVASGPMTATFILAFVQGVARGVPGADVLKDAFGMIALVAMTPIITLQILGLIVKIKAGKKKVTNNV